MRLVVSTRPVLVTGDGVVKLWKHRLAAPLKDSLFARHEGGIFSRYTAVAPIAAQVFCHMSILVLC